MIKKTNEKFVKFGRWSGDQRQRDRSRQAPRNVLAAPEEGADPAGCEPREWLPSAGEDCQLRGGCREGCCQLEWTAQDLPPPPPTRARSTSPICRHRAVISPAQLLLQRLPPFTPVQRGGFKQLHGGLICSRSHRRTTRKRKNHPLALLVEA